jgi:hypothetical protein
LKLRPENVVGVRGLPCFTEKALDSRNLDGTSNMSNMGGMVSGSLAMVMAAARVGEDEWIVRLREWAAMRTVEVACWHIFELDIIIMFWSRCVADGYVSWVILRPHLYTAQRIPFTNHQEPLGLMPRISW